MRNITSSSFCWTPQQRKSDLIDIRWQTRVSAIDSRVDGATLKLATPEGDYSVNSDWVVACDGGRSTIREALGLQLKGTSYEGRYVIVDIELESDRPTERLAYFDASSNPGSTVLVHKQPDNVWRIDYQLRDGEDAEQAVKPENVIPRVQSLLDMMGERGAWSPIWITIYKANALTLESYRHDRVLFGGDAAHLVPIFGVRGANSGIDDADNLAWKLAFVVRGLASEGLLDSYSDERVFAAHENLSYGTKSTEFMAPPSFAFELMRKAVLSLAVKHERVRSLINPRQTSAITYTASSLNTPDAEPGAFAAGPVPGAVLGECPLTIVEGGNATEAHLTDLVAPTFTALHFSEDGNVPEEFVALEASLRREGLPFKLIAVTSHLHPETKRDHNWDHTGRLFAMYGARPGTVYLVRPDGHVLGGGTRQRVRISRPPSAMSCKSDHDQFDKGERHDRQRPRPHLYAAVQDHDPTGRAEHFPFSGAFRDARDQHDRRPGRRPESDRRCARRDA